ncbi:MAG: NTP transferase domain-containing protein [Marinobacter sp.]|nr:NTP transferase domain-containing protein [Marinobacter sp.]
MAEINNMERPTGLVNGDVIAIVLAAGRSQRFGSDKRLTLFADGETLLSQTLSAVLPNFSHTYVVLKAEDDPKALLSQAYLQQVQILRAPHANCGLGSSLADALQMLQNADGLAAAIFLGRYALVITRNMSEINRFRDSGKHCPPTL